MIRIRPLLSAICAIAVAPLLAAEPVGNALFPNLTNDELEQNFQGPPDWAKPSVYWWWLNRNVDKEAITRDLEEFRAKGMGAVLFVSSGQWGGRMPAQGPAFLSDEWRELYKHALREAHRIGIKVDVNIAPGWNMGGPWVTTLVPPGSWTVARTGHRMTGAMLSVPMPGIRPHRPPDRWQTLGAQQSDR